MAGRTARGLAAAALLMIMGATSVPGEDALVSRGRLNRVPGSGEPFALGGYEAWLKVRGDGTVQQRFTVWARDLEFAEGTTLWMANPGEVETELVAELASSGGSARYQASRDTARDPEGDLPMGAARVLDLLDAPIELRDAFDEIILRGRLAKFRFKPINAGSRRPGVQSSKARLRRPRAPLPVFEEEARGFVRLWRRKVGTGPGAEVEQGITLYAQGITADGDYEVWMEDAAGNLHSVAQDLLGTTEGQTLWALDTSEGDTLPPELAVDDVRDLVGARVELRRAGDDGYTLVGLCPPVR